MFMCCPDVPLVSQYTHNSTFYSLFTMLQQVMYMLEKYLQSQHQHEYYKSFYKL